MSKTKDATTYSIKEYSIKEGPGTGHNDEIVTHAGKPSEGTGEYSVDEDGHPVVVMETGMDDGHPTYHDKRKVLAGAHSWDEAKEMVTLGDGEEIEERGLSGLQPGGYEKVDYYAVEVVTPDV